MGWLIAVGLSLITIPSLWAVDFASLPQVKRRQNWGVNFVKVQTVLNGATKYLHTFAVPIPVISHTPIPRMKCGTKEKLVHCQAINTMTGEINTMIDDELSRLKDTMELNLKAIPNIDDASITDITPRTHYRKRVKRDTVAGPDYCRKLKSGEDGEDGSGLGVTLGRVWSDITGSPTWDDIRVVNSHICKLADVINMTQTMIHHASDRMSSMSKTLNKRMDAIQNGMVDVNNRVTDTNNQLINISTKIRMEENAQSNRMSQIEATQELMFTIRAQLSKVRMHIVEFEEYVHMFTLGINTLLSGRLPPELIKPDDVQRVLTFMIETKVIRGSIRLVDPNPAFYYMTENVAFTRSEKYRMLYITMTVPLYEQGGILAIYRIDQTHIATKQGHLSSTVIVDLPDYLAVSADQLYYTEFNTAHLSSCRGSSVKICATEMSLRSFDSPSCAAALFKDDPKSIMTRCDIRYSDEPVPAAAIKLPDSTFLVHSPKAATDPSAMWDISCPESPEPNTHKIPVCSTCLIRINCGCKLIATGEFYIPIQLSDCNRTVVRDPSDVVMQYPANLAMLHSLLTPEQLTHVTGDTRKSRKWDGNIKPLKMVSQEWTNTVEASEKYSTKLKRLVELNNAESAAYETQADEALKRATNFNDLNAAHLEDLEKTFGGLTWLRALDPKATLGGVSVITLLLITSIIMGVYNCWRRAR